MSYYRPNLSKRTKRFSVRRGTGVPTFLIGIGIALVIVALFVVPIIIERSTAKYVTFTVSDKAVTATHNDNGHEYQIFATNGDVFKDTDSLAFFKFNSSNIYGQLQRGHTYRCEVSGFRIPILSAKNNIISCNEVSK